MKTANRNNMAEEKTTKAVLKMGIPVTMGTNRYERNGSIVFCEKHITIIVGM